MAQMTESLARSSLKYTERGHMPPITAWELTQLLHFWLANHERHAHRPAGYVKLDELPYVELANEATLSPLAVPVSTQEEYRHGRQAVAR